MSSTTTPHLGFEVHPFGSSFVAGQDKDWVILKIKLSHPDATWAWALPASAMAPEIPNLFVSRHNHAARLCASLCDMVQAQIKERISQTPDCRIDATRGDEGISTIEHPHAPGARLFIGSLEMSCYRTDVSDAGFAPWIDAGLRALFPSLPPMQGPFPHDHLEWRTTYMMKLAAPVLDAYIKLIACASASMEAQALAAATTEPTSSRRGPATL